MTQDRNKNRPGYKQTKAGWIPEDWDCQRFCKCCRIAEGQVDPRDVRHRQLLHVGPENIEAHTGRIHSLKSAKELGLVSGKYVFDANAIVYSKIRPHLNKVCLPAFEGLCSADCYPIWVKHENSRVYVKLFMLSSAFVRQSVPVSLRTGMPKINRNDLHRLWMILPPLPEQEKIAEVLSTWDAAIEQTRKLIDAKRRRKKALMQQLLTGKLRLPGFDRSWNEHKLGELFSERKETGHEDLPLLAVTGSRGIIPAEEVDRKDSSSSDKSRYKRICPGDIGYNTMRMWQGVSALSQFEGIVSPAYTICVPNECMDASFVSYFFKFQPTVYLFWRYSQGMVSDTLNLKYHNFAEISVKVPEKTEQRAIAKVLETADKEINLLGSELAAFEKQKRGLMQKLLTGEVRVRVEATGADS